MTARAIVYPGSFGDSTLPRVNLAYAPPLPGALYSWTADNLPLGNITTWASPIDGATFQADGGAPLVLASGNRRAVRFDGISNRMRCRFATPLSGAHSVVVVYRFLSPEDGDSIHFDYASAGAGSVSINANKELVAYGGGKWIIPSPGIAADTSWHVHILTIDGAASALRVDDREAAGTQAGPAREGITLGFSTAGRAEVEYARVDILGGSLSTTQRAAYVARLREQYNL